MSQESPTGGEPFGRADAAAVASTHADALGALADALDGDGAPVTRGRRASGGRCSRVMS
ncbi:hypothetical protein [Halobaculum litoreum]|uniref:Uncharacterized protein n=1 Tax=Halobaculum litoreum TaxID=3031998 RepID=A0ABD5XQH6_9EURY|nr:hypothetical protein [Halobaculum sp. DT92]